MTKNRERQSRIKRWEEREENISEWRDKKNEGAGVVSKKERVDSNSE